MKTSILNIKMDPRLKSDAQKVAEALGFSLSAIVHASLKNLVRSKTVSYSILEPTPMLTKAITSARNVRKKNKANKSFSSSRTMMKSLLS